MRLKYLPNVWSELLESAQWYEAEQIGLGSKLLVEVGATLTRIRTNPRLFPKVNGLIRRAQVARFPFGVFYEIEDASIVIFAVIDMRRDPSTWRSRISKWRR